LFTRREIYRNNNKNLTIGAWLSSARDVNRDLCWLITSETPKLIIETSLIC